MAVRLSFLPANAFELAPEARAAFAVRPGGGDAPLVPGKVADVPRPSAPLDAETRAELAETLEARLAEHEPPVAVLDAVRSLADPESAVVLATAPPGWCGGTLSVAWRALHAIRLARALADEWRRPVVPLFWSRTEATGATPLSWLDERVELTSPFSCGDFPAADRTLDSQTFDAARQTLGAWRAAVLHAAPRHASTEGLLEPFVPRDGESFASAFTRALLELFGARGLVVCESAWLRAPASQALADSVGELDLVEGTPVARRLVDGGIERLAAGGEGYRFEDEPGSRTGTELAAELVQEPESWAPAPELLPFVLARLFPLAAELVEWNDWELRLAAARAGVPQPPLVPRVTHTLLDPAAAFSLEALDRDPGDALRGAGAEEIDLEDSPEVVREMRALSDRWREELLGRRGDLARIDRGLAAQLRRVAAEGRDLVEKLATRAERVVRNRRAKRARHERRLRHTLRPAGRPQEEVLATLQFVLFNGRDWIDEVADEVDPFPTEHVLVHLPRRFEEA